MSAQIPIIYFSLSPYLAHCFSSCSVTLLLWIIWLWFCFYLKITMLGNPSINYNNNNQAIEVFNGICHSFAIKKEKVFDSLKRLKVGWNFQFQFLTKFTVSVIQNCTRKKYPRSNFIGNGYYSCNLVNIFLENANKPKCVFFLHHG